MMDRNAGTGPFAAAKEPLDLPAQDRRGAPLLPVLDSTGEPFCYIGLMDCHGRDLAAAKARAQRIAEALNRNDSLKAALIKAREIIQSDRDALVECATLPPHDDLTALDHRTKTFVQALDALLVEIDETVR